ncbi:MAG: bifunctional methylenetetrahydrofolate dehydrogenase/methenyltetrahydrofolate cyclohydrolase FolD [Deltaproteobacteria bacterium]
MGEIIDGKAIAQRVRAEVRAGAIALTEERAVSVGLALVRVGEDPASAVYVRSKIKACAEVGFRSIEQQLPQETPEAELLELVAKLNRDPAVHGILVQLPLPPHVDADRLLLAVDPAKDVDGFHPLNAGKLATGRPGVRACTPFGILRLLDECRIDLAGRRAVVVGRSNIVGKPMALLLLERHATVTICHSRTRDLEGEIRRADLVVAAIGRPELVKGAWIKEGAVVIDVGMNRLPDGKLVGDVEFQAALPRASWITPVPGGVGPMTVATLLANTLQAARVALGLA